MIHIIVPFAINLMDLLAEWKTMYEVFMRIKNTGLYPEKFVGNGSWL